MKTNEALIKKLKSNNANIGIIGLGYVGIPLALRFAAVGLKVTGFDIDQQRVDDLNAGKSPISNIASDKIVEMNNSGFVATSDLALISTVDAIIICVPTPLNKFREPDMSFIISTMTSIVPFIREQQLLSLESTTYPGTTRELLLPYIEQAGMTAGVDYFLVYSPEREDPGNQKFETRTIPKIVGGVTPACLEAGKALYAKAVDQVVSVATVEVAEMAKLLENIHRAVNIGLVNEMKIIADKMGINIIDVIDAAATKPFGFTPYYPGPGLGGHCIPIDPFYLTWKAREFGVNTRFIELAGEINQKMPDWVVSKIVGGLNNFNKSVKGSKILALGIAYKKDVDDMRESPAVMVMELLRILGAEVSYHDPYVPKFPKMREHKFDLSSIKLTDENIAEFDCVVVLTDHSNIDYNAVLRSCQFMVDTRNVIVKDDQKILRA